MELKDRLVFCNTCKNKKFDIKVGVLCALTDRKPDFEVTCKDFQISELEKQKNNAKEYTKKLNNEAHNFKNDFSKTNQDKLKNDASAFLKELKQSEVTNQSNHNNNSSQTPPWRIAISVIIAIVALVRLIMVLVD